MTVSRTSYQTPHEMLNSYLKVIWLFVNFVRLAYRVDMYLGLDHLALTEAILS